MMNSSVFSAAFSHESSFWSAFGDINKFDVQKNMYNYGTVRKYFKRLERMYERRVNPLDSIEDPEKIKDIFRLYPHRIIQLVELLKPELERNTKRNNSLSVLTQVCTALYYYGSGTYMNLVGECKHLGISKSSTIRCVQQVTQAILMRKDDFIQFPNTPQAIQIMKQDFMTYSGLPNVIGAIDGTHVKLRTPTGPDAHQYINRKGVPSINVSIVCGARRKILHINPCWPGSSHDSRVFKNSDLYEQFESGKYDGMLLGDSAYALRDYLMTPFAEPKTRGEMRFNMAHKSARASVENTIGMWKGRFAVLEGPLRHDPLKSAEIITATACIHNFAISKGDMWVRRGKVHCVEPHDPLDNYHYYSTHDIERQLDGKKVRAELVTNLFS